ncbi:PepSY domain-containing protein [Streptomyces abyssomicinicus]|uniref:PepSY domain-containing protein n=1 Tax=Streptomyces abyssomicinicus TaxID=574929 RepID=UPI00124FF6C9|nr:PepSY domain-containing protein [Streptomyces abyssomicinicus]
MSSADRTPSRRRAALAALVAAALVGGGTAAAVAVSGDDRDRVASASSARPDGADRDDDRDERDGRDEGGAGATATTVKADVRAAVTAALAEAKGVVASAELDDDGDGDRSVWEVEVVGTDGTRTEVLIDPGNGRALGDTRADDDDDRDDRDEAVALRKAGTDAEAAAGVALRKVPGTVVSVDFEHDGDDDRGRAPAWEVEVIGEDGVEREILVDAGSGKAALGGDDDRDGRGDRDDDGRGDDDADDRRED